MKNMIRYVSLLALLTTAHLTFADDTVTILRAGLWHGDEVTVESGPDWWGIFPEGDGFTLQQAPVTITLEYDAIMDEEGQATGKRVKVPQEAEPVLLIRGIAGLKEGRLNTPKAAPWKTFVYPGQSIDLKLSEGKQPEYVALQVLGGVKTGGSVTDLLLNDYTFNMFQHSGRDIITQTLATIPGNTDGHPEFVWAGDIDRDGKVDVLLNITNHYVVTHLVLYLSSAAKEGELVGKVAEHKTAGC